MSQVLKSAVDYCKRGWSLVPIPQGAKSPNLKNWTSMRLGINDLPRHFSNGQNIGVLLGDPSDGLVDLDLDAPEAAKLAPKFLPQTRLVHGRAKKPSSHYWFVSSHLAPRKFTDVNGLTLLEVRSTGQQTILPPSIHPSGEDITWAQFGDPALVEGNKLLVSAAKLAAATLMVRHYAARGSRHDLSNALSGLLLRKGWSLDEVETFVGAVAEAAGDEEWNQRQRDVKATARRLAEGGAATGVPTLRFIVGEKVVARLNDFLQLTVKSLGGEADGWPDPSPLGNELRPVPNFTLDLLPPAFRPLVEDLRERMQTPADCPAAVSVVALAGCVNRRAVIQPKAEDNSWVAVPNLWGAIIAPPGFMKSPVLRSVTRPLTKIEELWHAEHEQESSEFELAKEQADLRKQAWREAFKSATKKGDTPPPLPDTSISPPRQKRLLLTDSTFEKLHEILRDNPAGVLVVRDELTGWLAQLDRQGREGERAFYLQSWNGDAGFTLDRIGRGSIHVPAVCVSLLGNIQPARLRWYLSEALAGGPSDDGLFQRFQILVWPDFSRNWRLVDRPPNAHALRVVEQVFSTLVTLSADAPVALRFDPDAQVLFFEWWSELENKIRSDCESSPATAAHLAKYRSLMPSLAGLFELADWAAFGAKQNPTEINLDHAKQAAAFCEYLESHARRVYACVISPEWRAARDLARDIQGNHLPPPFTTRDVYLKGWSGLDSPELVRKALALLEDTGWVRQAARLQSPRGGRPTEAWLVNPKVVRREK